MPTPNESSAETKRFVCPRGHRHYEGSAFCTACGAGPVLPNHGARKRGSRMIWIQVALCTITGTAMIWGAFADIGWLFWGVGLPAAILTLVYTFLTAGFFMLWEDERRAAR